MLLLIPPCTSRACRSISNAVPTLLRLTIEIIAAANRLTERNEQPGDAHSRPNS